MMKVKKQRRQMMKLLLFILLVSISMGYALLRTNLTINGTSKIKSNNWDIHFENLIVNPNSVELSTSDVAATIQSNTTEVSYAITLRQPGDFYEFTVDAVNNGSIDGMIESVISKLNETDITTLPSYLEYSISYLNGREIKKNQILKSGDTETYKVRIGFKKDIESTDLPGSPQTLTLDFGVVYVQADSNAIPIIPETRCTYTGELVAGAEYVNGQYTYHYLEEFTNTGTWKSISNGWGVALTDVVQNGGTSTNAVSGDICTYINDIPVTSARSMFYNSQASSIDLSNFNTRNITNMNSMFGGVITDTLDLTNFDTRNVTSMHSMFLSSTSTNLLINDGFNTSKVTDMGSMFNNSGFNSLDLSYFDTSSVTDMASMFYKSKASTINIKSFDTSNVTSMQSMFRETSLNTIDLTNFDTSNVTDMGSMFYSALVSNLDISSFNTSKVTEMSGMFAGTVNLTSIDLSHFDTSKVTGMRSMFLGTGATTINLSGFDTSKVTNMRTMFRQTNMTVLDLSSFNTSSVTDTNGMFDSCVNLTTIYASELWNTDNVTDSTNMFNNCPRLPNYNYTDKDKTKAHYNTGGYLTYKAAPSN